MYKNNFWGAYGDDWKLRGTKQKNVNSSTLIDLSSYKVDHQTTYMLIISIITYELEMTQCHQKPFNLNS